MRVRKDTVVVWLVFLLLAGTFWAMMKMEHSGLTRSKSGEIVSNLHSLKTAMLALYADHADSIDQYGRIDKMGDETLRRDYVTNFLDNACILLNLDNKNAPNTSNLVERFYLDWNDRIGDLKCRMDKEAREADTTKLGNLQRGNAVAP